MVTDIFELGFGLFRLKGAFYLICFLILIYLIYRRIQIKKREDFDDRDN